MARLLGPVASTFVVIFLVSVMFSIGLEVTLAGLVAVTHKRQLLAKTLIGNFVVMPLLAILIARVLPLSRNVEVGLLLLAAAPGALFAINFTTKMKGSVHTAAALLLLLTGLSLVLTPPLIEITLRLENHVTVNYGRAMLTLLFLVALPAFAGRAVRLWAPSIAQAIEKPVSVCASISFVLVAILTMTLKSAATKQLGGYGVLALILLVVAGMFVGWVLGGPDAGTRRVLVVTTSMRNVALCLEIASISFRGMNVDVPIIAFSALMLPPNLLFTLYHARRLKTASATPSSTRHETTTKGGLGGACHGDPRAVGARRE